MFETILWIIAIISMICYLSILFGLLFWETFDNDEK